MRFVRAIALLPFCIAYSGSLVATEFGTAEEALEILERAVVALEDNKLAALDAFNESEGEYKDKDLYVFCGGSDGKFTAHPRGVGKWSLRNFKDISGEPIGEEMYSVAKQGEISEITYLLARGDNPVPYEKTSLFTKVGDQLCGVGYYNSGKRTQSGNLAINSSQGIVINGYDPVAYFTLEKATRGAKQFKYTWLESEWHFVNSEHRKMFIANPIKFIPQYGGYCTSAMLGGHLVPVDPENWRIIDERLYLFFSERAQSGWAENRDTNIVKADDSWSKIKPMLSN